MQYFGDEGEAIGDVGEYLGDDGDICAGAIVIVSIQICSESRDTHMLDDVRKGIL